MGCEKCSYGMVDPPEVNFELTIPHMALFQVRSNQLKVGDLALCDCRAGVAMGRMLRKELNRPADKNMWELLKENKQAALHRRVERLFDQAGVPEKFKEYSFETFRLAAGDDPGKQAALAAVQEYSQQNYVEVKGQRYRGLLLYGEPGVGKTGLLSPLFLRILGRGWSGLWVQYNHLLSQLRDFESGLVEDRMHECREVDYLFMDDFGDPAAQSVATAYTRDRMFQIIDYRNSHRKAMFITTNLDLDALSRQFHQRLVRRLTESCAVVKMGGRVVDRQFN